MRAALLVLLALMGAACTSTGTPVAAEPAPTTMQAALLTGPQAIEAAQGTPHILWFWGAN